MQLKERLAQTFHDGQIEVTDLTGTQDHYQVRLVSDVFAGLSRVQRQQRVMDCLRPELASGEVHALTLATVTVAEALSGK